MGEEVEEIKKRLIKIFPNLSNDINFKITSKETPNYNCIAWACNYEDRWIQPPYINKPSLDSVIWWPPNIPEGLEPECLKKVFEYIGYKECETSDFEEGFRKIAIYFNSEVNEWTHAARQKSNGKWTSKLGQYKDIQHGTPESIENENYGKIYCFMKKEFI